MVLPSLASTGDLEARLGVTLEGDALGRAEATLADASALIRSEAGLDWVDADGHLDAVPDVAKAICLAAAYRAFRNPDGAAQTSTGDVSISFGRTPPGALYLTEAELRAVRRLGGGSRVSTIALESPWAVQSGGSPYYVPVAGGGDPIPLGPFPWEVL